MKHWGPIAGMAVHGDWVATAGYDNQVILWDERTRRAVARGCHDHLVNHCAFSPDGQWLVSASSDGSARIWSVPDMRLHTVLPDHDDDVDMAVFSPDGQRIATCALDRQVRIFDRRGRCLHTMAGHTGNVLSLAWYPDGAWLVSSSVDGTLRGWDARIGRQLWCRDLQMRTDSVAVDGAGRVYAGDDLGRIVLIDGESIHCVDAHAAGIKKVVLDEHQGRLATLSYDRSLALWTLSPDGAPTLRARTELPADIWARAASLRPDGDLVLGTFGGTYARFSPATLTWCLDGVHAGPAINAICSTGQTLLAIGDAGILMQQDQPVAAHHELCNFLVTVRQQVLTGGQSGVLRDAHTGREYHRHHSPLNCAVAFERQGRVHVAVGSYTGEILVLAQCDDGAFSLLQTLAAHRNAIKGLAVGDTQLCAVSANTDISWHDLTTLHEVGRQVRGHERIANACCHLGHDTFASVSRDRHLRIWQGGQPRALRSPHGHSVKCMASDPQHRWVATGSYGGTVALFDTVTDTWAPMQRPTACGISSICWHEGGQAFVAASYDGHLYQIHP